MGLSNGREGGFRASLTVLTASILALAVVVAVIRHYLQPPPSGQEPVPAPSAVPSAAFPGDPAEATEKLLQTLNQKLESLDLLKLLSREVETRPATVQGKIFPTYREQFRLPLRYSAGELARMLDDAARTLGARLASQPATVYGNDGGTRYDCSFVYDAEWAPVEVDFVRTDAPKICLIIDDGGYQRGGTLDHLYGLKVPVTVSIIPDAQFSTGLAEDFPGHGVEVMCHLPMEGHEKGMVGNNYKELLKKGMDPAEAEREVERGLDGLPNVRGLNNHMGSVATTDPELMGEVCRVLKSKGLFIIDSRTTAQSVVEGVARKAQVPVAHRDVFLDNVETPAAILKQLEKTEAFARKHGLAVAIGHFKGVTLQTLEGAVRRLKDRGIQFVYASEVVQ